MALKTSNLAILFADISGSTSLYEVLGDEHARAKVSNCLELLTSVIERHAGTVIKTLGDEIMCTFPSAEQAAIAACDMQESLHDDSAEETPAGPVALAIRVGLHYGQAILEVGDVFGDAVNVASRMASMAKAGQIITTQSTIDELPPVLKANTRLIDRAPVKGKKETMDICEILWQQDDVTRMSTMVVSGMPDNVARMRLDYHKLSISLNAERTQVIIGRSKTADIPVEEVLASRLHVRIEQRRGKFFIIDQSTNGTYVKIGKMESFLRREEMPLSGKGMLSLGRPFIENPTEIVHFSFDS